MIATLYVVDERVMLPTLNLSAPGKITENTEVFPLDKKDGNAIFVKENIFLMSNYAN